MQAHQLDMSYYSQFYSSLPSTSTTDASQQLEYPSYAATLTHQTLNFGGFSGGSSSDYADQAYHRYLPEYGGPSTRPVLSSSAIHMQQSTLDATDMGIAGPSTQEYESANFFRGARIQNPQPTWDWTSAPVHGQPESMPVPCPNADTLYHKMSTPAVLPVVQSPTAQLPTPASMAVLLNSSARNPAPSPLPESTPDVTTQDMMPSPAPEIEPDSVPQGPSIPETHSREKRHGCWMCHKSFDRPSTLRKHLLVHTGEKAFVCDTCGRRFGVASNLNRHVRKCILKPVNALAAANSGNGSTSAAIGTSIGTSENSNKRGRATSLAPGGSDGADASAQPTPGQAQPRSRVPGKQKEPAPKRRRRAPSPSQWIPLSLLAFNLKPEEAQKAVPVPLPPVSPSSTEERDSWDENVGVAPYHPKGWKDRLPGPGLGLNLGLGGRDMVNMGLSKSGGFMLGRVAVF